MDFIYFLGRFHVLALHLPIGIILVVIALEWFDRSLRSAADFLWGAAAITAIGTAILGYMHFAEGGFEGSSGALHRFFGTSVAVTTTLVWIFRKKAYRQYAKVQTAAAVLLVALVTLTGHFGGNLTHGSTYLIEYAPGLAPAPRQVSSVEHADAYQDLVQPIFAQRCISCHNEDKRRGGLSLASHASLMKGGENGVVLVPGQPDRSDLFRRITLPDGEKGVMPAEGKPRLAPQQIAFIKWWIENGAPANTTLANLKVSSDVRQAAAMLLGLEGAKPAGAQATRVTADQKIVDALVQAGFIVRQQSQTDAHLSVSKVSPAPITAAQVQTLSAASDTIIELNLSRSGVHDEQLQPLSKLSALKRLNLANNAITDAGLRQLSGLRALRHLNLYGNEQITDAGTSALADMQELQVLYVWGTAITPAGAKRLRESHPKLTVNLGEELPRTAAPVALNAN
jgi:hypothetical protein